jgi:hypothetical protein
MKSNSSQGSSPDPDTALDAFFKLREMTPDDFASRTIAAARTKARQGKLIRFSAWTGGLAASLALLLGLNLWNSADQMPGLTATSTGVTEVAVASDRPANTARSSAAELTWALQEAVTRSDIAFYGQALALDALLAEAGALTEEDSRDTLDFLILLAGS